MRVSAFVGVWCVCGMCGVCVRIRIGLYVCACVRMYVCAARADIYVRV